MLIRLWMHATYVHKLCNIRSIYKVRNIRDMCVVGVLYVCFVVVFSLMVSYHFGTHHL